MNTDAKLFKKVLTNRIQQYIKSIIQLKVVSSQVCKDDSAYTNQVIYCIIAAKRMIKNYMAISTDVENLF